VLARVDEVLISDDYVLFLLFRGEILAAPQEDALEGFYQVRQTSLVYLDLLLIYSSRWGCNDFRAKSQLTGTLVT
jgi:hypothetical protein